jgi:hypothetical protein
MRDAPSRPTPDLTRHTISGPPRAYLGSAVGGVPQFGMTAALARLPAPSGSGLIALSDLFLRFVEHSTKAGVTQAPMHRLTLSTADNRAAFTLSAGLAAGFSALVFFHSPLATRIFSELDLPPVLQWLALGLPIQGLGPRSIAPLRRSSNHLCSARRFRKSDIKNTEDATACVGATTWLAPLASIEVAAIGAIRWLLVQYETTLTLPLRLMLVVVGAIIFSAVVHPGPLNTLSCELAPRLYGSDIVDSGSAALRRIVPRILARP